MVENTFIIDNKYVYIDRQIDRQIDRSIDRQIDRQIGRQIDRQIDIKTGKLIQIQARQLS